MTMATDMEQPDTDAQAVETREDWASSLVAADVAHFTTRLRAAALIDDPFPHMIIDDALPPDLADGVEATLGGIPPEMDRALRVVTDYQVPVSWLTPAARRLRALISEPIVIQAVLDRLSHVLAPLMDDGRHVGGWSACRPEALYPRLELHRDTAPMMLPPHADSTNRLFAALIYFPTGDAPQDLGTCLYRPLDPNLTCDGSKSHWFDKFDEAVRAPYRRNCMCLFARTDRSFHGFPGLAGPAERLAAQWSVLRNRHR